MDINVNELRKTPQINWLVPYQWMSKMTNEQILQWEDEYKEEYEKRYVIEKRNPNPQETKAAINEKARMIEIDYVKVQL
jgi:hypothetical protein